MTITNKRQHLSISFEKAQRILYVLVKSHINKSICNNCNSLELMHYIFDIGLVLRL